MPTTTNNPELLKLIGMELHVHDISGFDSYPKHLRGLLKANALNAKVRVHSIVFSADSSPEIGIIEDSSTPDKVVYYPARDLVFSAPTGSADPLPGGLFGIDGRLVVQNVPEAA